MQRYVVPEADQNSEPVFVPRPAASAEDDGWLLFRVYRRAADTSNVIFLGGRDTESDPVATLQHRGRIPAGFGRLGYRMGATARTGWTSGYCNWHPGDRSYVAGRRKNASSRPKPIIVEPLTRLNQRSPPELFTNVPSRAPMTA
jgi:hypothetical protein